MRNCIATGLLISIMSLCCAPVASACPESSSAQSIPITRFALVGRSIQEVLLEAPPPTAVYLAGADAELPRPSAADPIVFRYELKLDLAGDRSADAFVRFDPTTYEVESVTLAVRDELSLETVIEALDMEHRRERRRVASDDFDVWVTDEIDPEGQAEVVVFPTISLEVVQIEGMPGTTLTFAAERLH